MTWTTLLFLSLAIALWLFSRNRTDDVSQFLSILVAAICLTIGLINASILLKSLLLLGVILIPAFRQRHSLG